MTLVRNSTVLKALAMVFGAATTAGGLTNSTNSSATGTALATSTSALAPTPPPPTPDCDDSNKLVVQKPLNSTTCRFVVGSKRVFPYDQTYKEQCSEGISSCRKVCHSYEPVKEGASQLSVRLTQEKSLTLSLTDIKHPVAVKFHSGGCFVGGSQESANKFMRQRGVIIDKELTKYGEIDGDDYYFPCGMSGQIITKDNSEAVVVSDPTTLCLSNEDSKYFECVQAGSITITATGDECYFSLSKASTKRANVIKNPKKLSHQAVTTTTPTPAAAPAAAAAAAQPISSTTPVEATTTPPPSRNATFKASGNTSWVVILISMLAGGFFSNVDI